MNRQAFLTVSAASLVHSSAASCPVPGGTQLVERLRDFDHLAFDRAVARPARIRQLWETVGFHAQLPNNVKNALNGLEFGFGYARNGVAIIVAAHGPSTAYSYTDAVWQKDRIGEALNLTDADGNQYRNNIFLEPRRKLNGSADPNEDGSIYQDSSIQSLQKRGVTFSCLSHGNRRTSSPAREFPFFTGRHDGY